MGGRREVGRSKGRKRGRSDRKRKVRGKGEDVLGL